MLLSAATHKEAGRSVLIITAQENDWRRMIQMVDGAILRRSDFHSVRSVLAGRARGRRAKVFVDNEVTDMGQDTEEFWDAIGLISDE